MDVELQPRSVLACELVADVARSFGEVCLRVTGASMIPAVWPGDVVTVRRCDVAELQPGQIVLSRRGGRLVAHRITFIRGDLVTTRGDSLQHDDPPIDESAVVGRVMSLVRNGRVIDPTQTFWLRIGSAILRRSDFCRRMALRIGRRIEWLVGGKMSWAR